MTVDQASYVNEVPTTKLKLAEDTLLSLHPELVTEFAQALARSNGCRVPLVEMWQQMSASSSVLRKN